MGLHNLSLALLKPYIIMLAFGLPGRGSTDCEKGQVDLQLWTVGTDYESSVTRETDVLEVNVSWSATCQSYTCAAWSCLQQ